MKQNKKKEIIGFKSVDGNYFAIWKDEEGVFHLKNKYTEIPNEFHKYKVKDIKKMFNELCEVMSECEEVELTNYHDHPNSFFRVMYSDKTEAIFHEKEKAKKNICAFTSNVASYSEFTSRPYWGALSEVITIDHIRWVIKTKTESLSVTMKYLDLFYDDDYYWLKSKALEDGTIHIEFYQFGYFFKDILVVYPDGTFVNNSRSDYLTMLKDYGVKFIIDIF